MLFGMGLFVLTAFLGFACPCKGLVENVFDEFECQDGSSVGERGGALLVMVVDIAHDSAKQQILLFVSVYGIDETENFFWN